MNTIKFCKIIDKYWNQFKNNKTMKLKRKSLDFTTNIMSFQKNIY